MSRGSKVDLDVLPDFVFGDRQEAVGRAAAHRAQRAFRRDLERRMAGRGSISLRLGRRAMPSVLEAGCAPSRPGRALRRAPTGGFQHAACRARSASISFCVSVAARAGRRAERRRVGLSVSPVAALALRIALVEQRRDLARDRTSAAASAARLLRRRRRLGLLLLLRLGLLGSSFFSASAIGSTFGSGSLAMACFGSGFGGVGGFGSGFFGSASAPAASARRRSPRSPASSTTLAFGSSTGFASATFSTSGFGVSAFGAVLHALASSARSRSSEMMSTGSEFGGGAFERLGAERQQAPTASTAACTDRRYGRARSSSQPFRSPARPP